MGGTTMEGSLMGYALFTTLVLAAGVANVWGAPIRGIDLNTCKKFIVPFRMTEADRIRCCVIHDDQPIPNFEYDPDLPVRVRKPVHKLTSEEVARYERAYEIMRSLPHDDPRSLHQQNKLHCAHCSNSYSQFNSTEDFFVHLSWLIWPWHRWFVYFHERILGSLIGDDTFALPYWAWDVQNQTSESGEPANTIPSVFANKQSPLYHPLRSKLHVNPLPVDLSMQTRPAYNLENEVVKRNNYAAMWRTMVADVRDPESFYGAPYREGDAGSARHSGVYEGGPHVAVHQWTGDDTINNYRDMGSAEWGALDPIFYSHHANADRLWVNWLERGGQHLQDPDWLDAEFLFYNEHGKLVRVNIRQSLELEKLKVQYEPIVLDWLEHVPQSIREMNPKYARRSGLGNLWTNFNDMVFATKNSLVTILAKRFQSSEYSQSTATLGGSKQVMVTQLARPGLTARRSLKAGNAQVSILDETLVIRGVVTKPYELNLLVNVFIDLPEADRTTPLDCVESLGKMLIHSENRKGRTGQTVTHQFSHQVGIGPRYDILNITRSRSVAITLVGTWDEDDQVAVEITDLTIKLSVIR